MKRRFTDDDLLRFLYNEMPPADSDLLMDALVKDEELFERYESFQQAAEQLSEVSYQPSAKSVEAVMSYVRESAHILAEYPEETPSAWQRVKMASGKSLVVGLNSLVLFGVGIFLLVAVGTSALPWHKPQTHETNIASAPVSTDVDLSWDDTGLEAELTRIQRGVERLRMKPVL
ncbi:MAG: hypothetical protein NWR72_21230 [Bacteroidia bacterium]|nr:hypothetical protein [Bacteroidia bacterium]